MKGERETRKHAKEGGRKTRENEDEEGVRGRGWKKPCRGWGTSREEQGVECETAEMSEREDGSGGGKHCSGNSIDSID